MSDQNPILGDYLSEDEAARELGYRHKRTLWRWRSQGNGPPYVRVGQRVMYRRSSIATWLADREQAA